MNSCRTGFSRCWEGKMERVDKILCNQTYQEHLKKNLAAEADRRFCRHNMAHFLDVARIARILCLEEHIKMNEEYLYAAALLHDIGRHVQYENGTPHEIASARIAPVILSECGFSEEESIMITEAILAHRDISGAEGKDLKGILYRADKASRPCFACTLQTECHWESDKKNLTLRY